MAGVVPLQPMQGNPRELSMPRSVGVGLRVPRRLDRLHAFQRESVARCGSPGSTGARCAALLGWANSRRGARHPARRRAARRTVGHRIAPAAAPSAVAPPPSATPPPAAAPPRRRTTAGAVTFHGQTGSAQNRRQCQSHESARHRAAGRGVAGRRCLQALAVRPARDAARCGGSSFPAGRRDRRHRRLSIWRAWSSGSKTRTPLACSRSCR